MATKKWFVLLDGEEMGPLGPGGLRKLVRRGEISSDTQLRREDHSDPVLAAQVQGLLPAEAEEDLPVMPGLERPKPHATVYGPYTYLRTLGWSTAGAMFAFAALGVVGVVVALGQIDLVGRHAGAATLPDGGDAELFGIGVFAVLALVAVGGLFIWWLWTACVNLPHLINAHIHNPPSWAIAGWLIPLMNLLRPYTVVSEVDRLSAEAEADGDASVAADRRLLVPWWATAILGTALAVVYMLVSIETIGDLQFAAWVHLAAGICTFVAGALAGWIVLRITNNQERAHDRHPEPVELRHEFGRRRRRRVASTG